MNSRSRNRGEDFPDGTDKSVQEESKAAGKAKNTAPESGTGEKSLVIKNEYENIHKVFNLKDINTKFIRMFSPDISKSRIKFSKPGRGFLRKIFGLLNKKAIVITLLILLNALFLLSSFTIKYKVYLDDKYVGEVRGAKEFSQIVDEACKQISAGLNHEVCFDDKIEYKPVIAWKAGKVGTEEIIGNLKDSGLYKRKGYAICLNGAELITLPDRQMAESLIQKLQEPYKEEPEDKVEFIDSVEIKGKAINQINAVSFDEALEVLARNKVEPKIYKVEKGDSLWYIARKCGLTIDELADLNPGLTEIIHEGQKIKLEKPVPLIGIRTTKMTTENEEIPFEIAEEKDSKKYRNQRKVVVKGKNGLKKASIKIVEENGIEIARNVISEEVIKQPVTQKESVGTKVLPPRWGTGSFNRPVLGVITSRFGRRWGAMHEGIDIDGNIGDPIRAADGGKVIFVGTESGYGKIIKISHDNEYITYYGHCSKILVKKGDRVAKGQKIGLIGMTGRTTGPHLHFEIRKNGVPQNPVKYLK